jgi:BASS family bile acid:Na+ symporter
VDLKLVVWALLVTGVLLMVTALGLQADPGDGTALLRQPRRLFRSMLAMLVVMPIVAVGLGRALDLDPAVRIALASLALSPVPPFLPPRSIRAGSGSSYAIGLLVATSIVSIIQVPVALALMSRVLDIPLSLSFRSVLLPVGWSVLAPLLVGLVVRRFAPAWAARVAVPAARLATLLFLLGLAPLMVSSLGKAMPLIGIGTLLAMLVFSLTGLGVGHLLGDGAAGDRATLALATAARHPGVALAIAVANFPDQTLVLPALLLYILLGTIVSVPYFRWATATLAKDVRSYPARRPM